MHTHCDFTIRRVLETPAGPVFVAPSDYTCISNRPRGIMYLKIHTMRKVVDLLFSLDGMFGRCEAAPLTDVYTYDITPATVQRFRTLLQRLAHRGRCISVAVATAHINVTTLLFLELLSSLGLIKTSACDAVCVFV